ncbi:MAG: terminase family protein, partial [Lachnospiraceae bacterium]|nr:terminase family protein [Lachnospiraceae bacterium]
MIKWSSKQADLIMARFDRCVDWLEGTPRSGKTTAGTMRFARHLIKSRDNIHLVTAYSAEQAYRLIMDGDGFGLIHIFKGHCRTSHDDSGAHLLIHFPDGDKKVYWKGGGKADSHKAITGMSLGSVYFCEINLLHDSMIQECFRRTYAARDRWHIADLNPPSPADPCIKNVLAIQDARFVHWTCADNPILTPERLREIEAACRKSPFLYKRDWLGERVIPEGVIYWMFSPEKHILSKVPDDFTICEAFVAGDGGTTDATSIGFYLAGFYGDRYFGPRE